jgi:hypothetical protein
MGGAEFDALKEDILDHGLRHRIVLYKGMILDGGNRYAACLETGVPPLTVEYNGNDPASYALSVNLHRRHLAAGQSAAIVAAAADWSKSQKHGGARVSSQEATLHLETVAARAAQSGASERTQKDADKVAKTDPNLAKQVAHGEITLAKAKEQVTGKARPAAKRPSAKPVKPLEIVANSDAGYGEGDILADLQAEVIALQAQIDALSAPDQAAELLKITRLYQHAVKEKDVEMDKNARLLRQRDILQKFQSDVVAAVGAADPKDALARIRARRVA